MDTEGFKVHLAAEVKDFVAKERMDVKAGKENGVIFPICSCCMQKKPWKMLGLIWRRKSIFSGVSVGSGIGSLQAIEREYKKMLEKGPIVSIHC